MLRSGLVLWAALGIGCHAFLDDSESSGDDGDAASRVAEELAAAVDSGLIGAVAAIRIGDRRHIAAAGQADVENGVAMRVDHRFPIAENEDSMIGAAFARLAASGAIDLDAPAAPHLPAEVVERVANARSLTVRQLLIHRSGVPDVADAALWDDVLDGLVAGPDADEAVARLYDRPARFAPGERFEYSSGNYLLARLILDRLFGAHHALELRRIIDQVPMPSAYIDGREPPTGPLARGYEDVAGDLALDDVSDLEIGTVLAGGAVIADIGDLADYAHALGTSLLDGDAGAEMFSGLEVVPGERYGLGVWIESGPTYGHEARPPGYLTLFAVLPERDIAVAVGINQVDDLAEALAPELLDQLIKAFEVE